MSTSYRLDRSYFQAMTMQEADKQLSDYSHLSWQERLAVVNYLNSVAYNFPLHNPPAMDRSVCTPRNLLHG